MVKFWIHSSFHILMIAILIGMMISGIQLDIVIEQEEGLGFGYLIKSIIGYLMVFSFMFMFNYLLFWRIEWRRQRAARNPHRFKIIPTTVDSASVTLPFSVRYRPPPTPFGFLAITGAVVLLVPMIGTIIAVLFNSGIVFFASLPLSIIAGFVCYHLLERELLESITATASGLERRSAYVTRTIPWQEARLFARNAALSKTGLIELASTSARIQWLENAAPPGGYYIPELPFDEQAVAIAQLNAIIAAQTGLPLVDIS